MAAVALEDRNALVDRIVDVATVLLISLAAFGTAWCSYQSARWSGLEALNYSRANAARVQSSTYIARAGAHRITDVMMFAEYARALEQHSPFASFLRDRFDPPLAAAVKAWIATDPLHNAKAPPSPFAMAAYHLPDDAAARDANARADAFVQDAVTANETSDRYIFLTVFFAAASFLGGLTIKLRRPMHVAAVSVGFAIFFISVAIMVSYPTR